MDAGGVCLVMDVRLRAHAEQKLSDSFASWCFFSDGVLQILM